MFEKTDSKELQYVTKKKIDEKIRLKVIQLQQFTNNKKYNCNIYLYNIEKFKS